MVFLRIIAVFLLLIASAATGQDSSGDSASTDPTWLDSPTDPIQRLPPVAQDEPSALSSPQTDKGMIDNVPMGMFGNG